MEVRHVGQDPRVRLFTARGNAGHRGRHPRDESDAAIIDALEGTYRESFMLHYNFPPFSVGEAGFMGGPKRREIGHGRLARRGVQAVLPDAEDFPYTLRVVSEITESNGSSSMASVCVARALR